MFNLLYALLLAGGFCLLLSVCWFIFVTLLYIVYRLDGGKMNYFRYLNKM